MAGVIIIREATAVDRPSWRTMRKALWPDASGHEEDIARILGAPDAWAFIAEVDDVPLGFAEVSIRKAANGCESQPVPFLEGIWVQPLMRRQRIGAQLMKHVEAFLKALGFNELGSDSLIENKGAHDAHRAWGFSETERVVYFRKAL